MDAVRIGDDDREAAARALGEHYAEGRLTKEEFDERSDAAWSARTRGDLSPLFEDLPSRTPARPAAGPTRGPVLTDRGPRRERRRPGRGLPLMPLLLLVVAVILVTEVPFVLLAVGLWFVVAHCRR